jgi:mRNA interferase RelE/StbE
VYRVRYERQAARQLDDLPLEVYRRVDSAIEHLALNPHPPGCLKLSAEEGYRIRIGKYRVLYTVDDQTKSITIYRVKHRSQAYRP